MIFYESRVSAPT